MSETPPRTILLVEDSADDRAMIRRLLLKQRPGYTLVEESTGEAGLLRVRSDRPDCLLLDFYLPDMEGTDFLDRLRVTGGGGVPLPVALLTGRESNEVAAQVLQRGAQDYLLKDALTGPALARAVENAIEKFTAQRTLERRNRELEALREQLQARLTELAEATRVKDRFLAVMSHEMRTPLNAILGYAELLEMGIGGELLEGQRAHVARIRTGGSHLLELINDLLDITRADANHLELDIRSVQVTAVAEEVIALLEAKAKAAGLALRLEPCPDSVRARADLRRLRQILTNLVGNALKFTEEGSVTVRCDMTDTGSVRVQVSDTGIGIEPDVLPLVFEDFYQADSELTRIHGGSGLGLAISKRLAKLMGGDVTGESTPGEGSTFTLLLPSADGESVLREEDVEEHAARMQQHRAGVRPREAAREPVTVLAFSDREEVLRALADRVRPTVRLVHSTEVEQVPGLAAREMAGLVVLDIGCCDGVAWGAAHAVRDDAQLADTPILLLPTIPDATPGEDAGTLDLGWVSLVPKPFTPSQLTSAVTALARGRKDAETRAHRVLILDDDPDSRRIALEVLREAGAEVREVAEGEAALAMMRRDAPDVLVLDLMMPVLDGFGVLAAMRTDALLARIPVVVLTAKSLSDAEREFLARSAARVLYKGEHRLADVAALVLRAAGTTTPTG